MAQDKDDKVDVSKRMFFRSAVAVVGAVTTAGLAKAVVNASKDNANQSNKAQYVKEALQQERVMLQKQYVVMTDDEKQQMLVELLKSHAQGLA